MDCKLLLHCAADNSKVAIKCCKNLYFIFCNSSFTRKQNKLGKERCVKVGRNRIWFKEINLDFGSKMIGNLLRIPNGGIPYMRHLSLDILERSYA